jgi:hypothetical protein
VGTIAVEAVVVEVLIGHQWGIPESLRIDSKVAADNHRVVRTVAEADPEDHCLEWDNYSQSQRSIVAHNSDWIECFVNHKSMHSVAIVVRIARQEAVVGAEASFRTDSDLHSEADRRVKRSSIENMAVVVVVIDVVVVEMRFVAFAVEVRAVAVVVLIVTVVEAEVVMAVVEIMATETEDVVGHQWSYRFECYSTDWEELCDCQSRVMAELLRESFVVLTTDSMVVVMVVVVVVVTHVMAFASH